MKKEFNIEQAVGKKMPYSVPDGFFDKLEQDVMARVEETKPATTVKLHTTKRKIWGSMAMLAVAACAAVLLVVRHNVPAKEAQPYEFDNVELAYNNLSTDDQQFLIEIYSESEDEDEELLNYEEN